MQNKVYVEVSGPTGSGKSAVCGEIEIALRAIGLKVNWTNGQPETNCTHADWQTALDMYDPEVKITERNGASLAAQLAEARKERDDWRQRESETQEALQAIGAEFGAMGGEPRTSAMRRLLSESKSRLAAAESALEKIRIYGEGHQECRQIAIAALAALRALPAEKPGEPETEGVNNG